MFFFNTEQWIFFFSFHILTASHELFHIPQLAGVSKLLSAGLALHAMMPSHQLFPKCHGLEGQVTHDKDFSDGDVARGYVRTWVAVLNEEHAALNVCK